MIRKTVLHCLLIMPILFLSGCWDKKELTDIAFVAAFGVDRDEDGHYLGTFQIINPGNVAGGLQGGGSSSESSTVTVYEVHGDNLTEVSRRAASEISRVLFYSHTNLVVIGEELAKEEGIAGFMDAFDRDERFRNTADVVIAKDTTANTLLKVSTPIDKIPANKITKTLEFSEEQWGAQWPVNIRELLNVITSDGREATLPSFRYIGKLEKGESLENLQRMAPDAVLSADGISIFKRDKLVGYLVEDEALGMAWIMDEIKQTTVGIDWDEKSNPISFQTIDEKTKTTVKMAGEVPVVSIHIVAKGKLGEVNVPINIEDYQVRQEIAKKAEQQIKELVLKSIEKSKTFEADVFGFGSTLYRNDPVTWRKVKKEWSERYYPQLEANIQVKVNIVGTGLRKNSFDYQDAH